MTGPQLLRRYLKKHDLTIADLSRTTGLDDGLLSRLVRGERKSLSLATAAKIDKGTNGEVPMPSWLDG